MERAVTEVYMERMTWPQVEAAVSNGKRTAVVVVAASEQHGPHLPEGTDTIIGEELGGRVARAMRDALVAPVIRPGCSDHHMDFPGTITVDADLLMRVLDAYIDSLRVHGFIRFVVFPSHAGNVPALAEWKRRQPPDVVVIADLEGYTSAMLEGIRHFGRNDVGGPHADLSETSVMLALRPELVHMELAEAGRQELTTAAEVFEGGLKALTPNGVLGDARGATVEIGESVLRALTDFLLASVTGAADATAEISAALSCGPGSR